MLPEDENTLPLEEMKAAVSLSVCVHLWQGDHRCWPQSSMQHTTKVQTV